MRYYEPNGIPDEIKKQIEQSKRVIRVRFQTKEDVLDFVRKTGITITHKSEVKIHYPEQDIFNLGN